MLAWCGQSLVFASRARRIIGATSVASASSISRWWVTLPPNKLPSLSSVSSSSLSLVTLWANEQCQTFSTCTTTTAASFGDGNDDDVNSKGNHNATISSAAFAREVNEARQNTSAAMRTSLQTPDNSNFFHNGKPTLAYVRSLPKTFATMTNEQVIHFGELGVPEACRECIVRDIMMVDCVEYDEVRWRWNEPMSFLTNL